jgi:hypothetical protein
VYEETACDIILPANEIATTVPSVTATSQACRICAIESAYEANWGKTGPFTGNFLHEVVSEQSRRQENIP